MDEYAWWQKAVFYQIYPRSFKDSTNNGIGDLKGIISKLDYLAELGIDAIWYSPFFMSPQEDFGYDITAYDKIAPEYGTMDDFESLLEKSHALDIKMILDLVLNHTSDKHPWFLESKKDQTNSKADWYVWKDGKGKNGKKPPNNWKSIIGGSMWKWNEDRCQFYLHQFLPCQPDLNWRNEEVKKQMFYYIKYWLDKGVDGFRLDIIHTLFEDNKFRDNPKSWRLFPSEDNSASLFQNPKYTQFLPETIEICRYIRKIVNSYSPPRMLVGEATGGPKVMQSLYGAYNDGLNLVFNFSLCNADFSSKKVNEIIQESELLLPIPYWPCFCLSNHDNKRMISKLGNNEEKMRLITLLILSIRGTPFIYYGEEIGMFQVKIPKNQWSDPIAFLKFFKLPIGHFFNRDGCRTPMQWKPEDVNAGFSLSSSLKPWLPVSPSVMTQNVETQLNKKDSLLKFYHDLLKFRKNSLALQIGTLSLLSIANEKIVVYKRIFRDEKLYIFLNFSNKAVKILNPTIDGFIAFSTKNIINHNDFKSKITLDKFEGIIVKPRS